jgi:polyhydroxyalkanoate synthesis repressor PhaR
MKEDAETKGQMQIDLRRYPNRRYYDCTRSQHLTLEDIYRLVCNGYTVTVHDSKSGEDITARVLAQLILEHDPPKLVAFPAELLHQIIRSNESLLREFVEKYFNQALTAFLKSQREFDQYLGQSLGLYSHLPSIGRDWAEIMMGPFARAFLAGGHAAAGNGSARTNEQPSQDAELRKSIEELKQEVAALRRELKEQ